MEIIELAGENWPARCERTTKSPKEETSRLGRPMMKTAVVKGFHNNSTDTDGDRII